MKEEKKCEHDQSMLLIKSYYIKIGDGSIVPEMSFKPKKGYILHPAFKQITRRCKRRTVSRFQYTHHKKKVGMYVGIYEKLDNREEK